MGDVSIRVEHLSKKYSITIGRKRGEEGVAERLTHKLRQVFRSKGEGACSHSNEETVWPVQDVSFEIKPGEVVGIIGRNGAGKSTLLKLLSRITEPTSGRVEIFGRVGTLLEVGTGFHPDLTGRDNIYLSGIILGMKKAEIDKKFDEIVAFSDIEKYIDTPVKRYSSGMYVRLAFAVGAHLEPEVLIVDEVLAVGDVQFQKKCLSKMHDIGEHGRTVLFVSHNMQAVSRLCGRAILLDQGKVVADGNSHQVVSDYLRSSVGFTATREWPDVRSAPGTDVVRLLAVRVRTQKGELASTFDIRHPVGIEMEYEVLKPGYVFHPHYNVHNEEGTHLFVANDLDPEWRGKPRPSGRYVSTGWIPGNFLQEGTIIIGPSIRTNTFHLYERDAVAFQVVDSTDGDTSRGDYPEPCPGILRPALRWDTRHSS
jgi:lipopolysaccharide transport system ATP-binding protein